MVEWLYESMIAKLLFEHVNLIYKHFICRTVATSMREKLQVMSEIFKENVLSVIGRKTNF